MTARVSPSLEHRSWAYRAGKDEPLVLGQVPLLRPASGRDRRRALPAHCHGVTPDVVEFPRSTDAAIALIERVVRDHGFAGDGERVVIDGSAPMGATGPTNFVQVYHLPTRASASDSSNAR